MSPTGTTWLNASGQVIMNDAGEEIVCDDCPCGGDYFTHRKYSAYGYDGGWAPFTYSENSKIKVTFGSLAVVGGAPQRWVDFVAHLNAHGPDYYLTVYPGTATAAWYLLIPFTSSGTTYYGCLMLASNAGAVYQGLVMDNDPNNNIQEFFAISIVNPELINYCPDWFINVWTPGFGGGGILLAKPGVIIFQ